MLSLSRESKLKESYKDRFELIRKSTEKLAEKDKIRTQKRRLGVIRAGGISVSPLKSAEKLLSKSRN